MASCRYIEATSQDISQEVRAWSKMGLQNGQCPQAYFQSCGKIVSYGCDPVNGIDMTTASESAGRQIQTTEMS